MHTTSSLILVTVLIGFVFLLMVCCAKRYKRCPVGKVMVIIGLTPGGKPVILKEGGAFVWPLLQFLYYLDRSPVTFSVSLDDLSTADGKPVSLTITGSAAINTEPRALQAAAERLLSLTPDLVGAMALEFVAACVRTELSRIPSTECTGAQRSLHERSAAAANRELAQLGMQLVSLSLEDFRLRSVS